MGKAKAQARRKSAEANNKRMPGDESTLITGLRLSFPCLGTKKHFGSAGQHRRSINPTDQHGTTNLKAPGRRSIPHKLETQGANPVQIIKGTCGASTPQKEMGINDYSAKQPRGFSGRRQIKRECAAPTKFSGIEAFLYFRHCCRHPATPSLAYILLVILVSRGERIGLNGRWPHIEGSVPVPTLQATGFSNPGLMASRFASPSSLP
jgi:hypothetical protein